MSDGRIVVTWDPVVGAVRYRLWRSVPPAPTTAITQPNPELAEYIDSNVQAGSTYYYVVSAINEAGLEGLKGSTTPVIARIAAGSTTSTPPQSISARLLERDPPRVEVVISSVAGAVDYVVERRVYSGTTSSFTTVDSTNPQSAILPVAGTSFQDTLPSQPYARSVTYLVTPRLLIGTIGIATGTTVRASVDVPAGSGTPGSSEASGTTGTTSTSSATPVGSTTLTVAVPARVAAGASTSLSAVVGSSARWLSLDESVATVDSSGTITGRAAGHTRILALSSSSDGSLRVVAIPVLVQP